MQPSNHPSESFVRNTTTSFCIKWKLGKKIRAPDGLHLHSRLLPKYPFAHFFYPVLPHTVKPFWLAIITLHCPLRQTPLLGVSEHGVPSFTLPKLVVSPAVVAHFRTHLGPPEKKIPTLKTYVKRFESFNPFFWDKQVSASDKIARNSLLISLDNTYLMCLRDAGRSELLI